jgi:hypothetical protein
MTVRQAQLLTCILVATALVTAGCAVPGRGSKLGGAHAGPKVYGPIFDAPHAYRSQLLVDPWIDRIPVGGTSTFGREIVRQVRIDIDGHGALADREVHLQTPPSVALFGSRGGDRMRTFLHGSLDVLDAREGYIRGMSLTTSKAGYEAAALSGIIEKNVLDGEFTAADRAFVSRMLSRYARETSRHTLAWYDPRTTWVTVGPDVSRIVEVQALQPGRVSPVQGIEAALVLRHEFEHAVTPASDDDYERLKWLEEGLADTLARWPGVAASTARSMGLPYPRRYLDRAYDSRWSVYPAWVATVRLLLQAAAIDTTSPSALGAATRVLQGDDLGAVPARIAARIASKQGLSRRRQLQLQRGIERLGGNRRAALRLGGNYL